MVQPVLLPRPPPRADGGRHAHVPGLRGARGHRRGRARRARPLAHRPALLQPVQRPPRSAAPPRRRDPARGHRGEPAAGLAGQYPARARPAPGRRVARLGRVRRRGAAALRAHRAGRGGAAAGALWGGRGPPRALLPARLRRLCRDRVCAAREPPAPQYAPRERAPGALRHHRLLAVLARPRKARLPRLGGLRACSKTRSSRWGSTRRFS